MKKVFAALLTLCLVFSGLGIQAHAAEYGYDVGETFISGDFVYEVINGSYDDVTLSVKKYTGTDTEVTIPTMVNGYYVDTLGSHFLSESEQVTKLYIPDSICDYTDDAFSGCNEDIIVHCDPMGGFTDYAEKHALKVEYHMLSEKDGSTCSICGAPNISNFYDPASNFIFIVTREGFSEDESQPLVHPYLTAYKYDGLLAEITVPREVSGLLVREMNGCFDEVDYEHYTDIKKVVIPDSVQSISEYTFAWENDSLVIHCGKGSCAEQMAKEKGYQVENHTYDSDGVCSICGAKVSDEAENNDSYLDTTPSNPGDGQEEVPDAPTQKPSTDTPAANVPSGSGIVKATNVKIDGISKKIAAGKKVKLTAEVFPANASNKTVTWTSSNPKVATVNQKGVVKVKKKSGGKSAVITATTADGAKATYKIKSMKGAVKKVSVSGKSVVKAGKTLKLKAKASATKGANTKLTWSSSNESYAKVSASGKVKTMKVGKGKKVKITAMATDGSNKAKTVTIKLK